jgi:hypothetical protein
MKGRFCIVGKIKLAIHPTGNKQVTRFEISTKHELINIELRGNINIHDSEKRNLILLFTCYLNFSKDYSILGEKHSIAGGVFIDKHGNIRRYNNLDEFFSSSKKSKDYPLVIKYSDIILWTCIHISQKPAAYRSGSL